MAWVVGEKFVWEVKHGRALRVGTIVRVTASGRGVDNWGNVWLPDGREHGGRRTAHAIEGWYADRLEAQGRRERMARVVHELTQWHGAITPKMDEALGRISDLIRIAREGEE